MTLSEMDEWFDHYLPAVPSRPGETSPCWIGRMKTPGRSQHNPPFYWLARAFDAVEADGATETMHARMVTAHGPEECDGTRDDNAQRVLSEICAYAWTVKHLGSPVIEPVAEAALAAAPSAAIGQPRVRFHLPPHDMYVLPTRLRPETNVREILDDIVAEAHAAADALPHGRGLMYLDMWYGRMYPANPGYDLDLTEPVQAVLRQVTAELHLGHVFTRPFQWGNPVATSY